MHDFTTRPAGRNRVGRWRGARIGPRQATPTAATLGGDTLGRAVLCLDAATTTCWRRDAPSGVYVAVLGGWFDVDELGCLSYMLHNPVGEVFEGGAATLHGGRVRRPGQRPGGSGEGD